MDDRRYSALTKLGFGVLACNSALAVCKSWGDAGSVAFVLVADAALVLLFACLREFERRRGAGGAAAGSGRIKAAVWALTTLLTTMFTYASMVAPLMPLVVGALIFLCLRESEWAQIRLGGQYAELLQMGFGVAACNSALAHHHTDGGEGSLAFVFIAYAGFVSRAWLFLRRLDGRARACGAEQ
jgi:intracellular sulfur oxidation DsrE/DsrF family protein